MKFIVFEGIDGSGKSTLLNKLAEHLTTKGFDVEKIQNPGTFEISQDIRMILEKYPRLEEQEKFLLFATNHYLVSKYIAAFLDNKKKIFLMDRYIFSTFVYQKNETNGLTIEYMKYVFKYLPIMPTLTIVAKVHPLIAKERILQRSEKTTLDEHALNRLFELYDRYEELPTIFPNQKFEFISTAKSEEESFEKLLEKVKPILGDLYVE